MMTRPQYTYEDISKALNISRDRYKHIVLSITRMMKDYRENVADIVKEIPLNFKGKERYFAMFMMGRSSSSQFSIMNDERKADFIMSTIGALKISQDMAILIASDVDNMLLGDKEGYYDISTIDIMKKVIDGDLKDVEKDYMSFLLGLIYI